MYMYIDKVTIQNELHVSSVIQSYSNDTAYRFDGVSYLK